MTNFEIEQSDIVKDLRKTIGELQYRLADETHKRHVLKKRLAEYEDADICERCINKTEKGFSDDCSICCHFYTSYFEEE